jgi:hypothetical protein
MADGLAEIEEGGIIRTLKDLFAGAAGGVAQVLLGMGIFLPLLCAGGIEIGVSYLVTCRGRFPLHGSPDALVLVSYILRVIKIEDRLFNMIIERS